ncbi:MAG: hypothetical protein KJ061_17210 [Vicinamibacteraceae bacterium]|nr:hypothetical protein [Vicinamibacteraceae bacterium]
MNTALDRRVQETLAQKASAIPFIVGGCGSGRTRALLALRDALGPARCQYVDVERLATTPERFLRALVAESPFVVNGSAEPETAPSTPREAVGSILVFLNAATTRDGAPATFLLDEVLELRTFESFPGLRTIVTDTAGAMAHSRNRFVLSSRFATRARKLFVKGPARIEWMPVPPLSLDTARSVLVDAGLPPPRATDLAHEVQALAADSAEHARLIADALTADTGAPDPISALVAALSPGGRLDAACRFSYELRLHRARGYGALKAILDILAEEQPLSLTAIAQRLGRTPGSAKDYLSWLEDVDLVTVNAKRYRITSPLLRLWLRLYRRSLPPTEDDLAAEVHRFALERLAVPAPAPALAADAGPAAVERPTSDIIEFD